MAAVVGEQVVEVRVEVGDFVRRSAPLTHRQRRAKKRKRTREVRLPAGSRHVTYIEHDCNEWRQRVHGDEGQAAYSTSMTRCLIHGLVMLDFAESGRRYPSVQCLECLPDHDRLCPMGNPSVLESWASGITCICPKRLTLLGKAIMKLPIKHGRQSRQAKASGRSRPIYGVGPIHVEDEETAVG